jgi:hypothetical protein
MMAERKRRPQRRISRTATRPMDGVSKCAGLVLWLGRWRCACSCCLGNRWLNSGDEVCAGVGSDMEDGVDAEGQHCKGVLGGEEPDECHSYGIVSISTCYVLRGG